MKISIIISSVKIVPELVPLIMEILTQAGSHGEIDCRVVLVTQYNAAAEEELKKLLAQKYYEITHVTTEKELGYFAMFNLALQQNEVADSDVFVFMNDDVILRPNFIDFVRQIPLDRKVLYAPVVYQPNGDIQLSVFRKDYSKFSMFFRCYDDGLYSKIGKLFNILDTKIENINKGRFTVFGCCFIMNQLTVSQMEKFDARIFLYYEEVFLFAMVRKFKWECRVLTDLSIIHSGGGTVTKKFTLARSYADKKSAIYVAKQYLSFNSAQLFILWVFKWVELCMRQFVSLCSSCFE